MPRKKSTVKQIPTVEADGSWEVEATTTAVLDPQETVGDVAGIVADEITQDQERWQALVFEVVDSGTETPPAAIVQRLALAFSIPANKALQTFQSDCEQLKKLRHERAKLERNTVLHDSIIQEHATEKELQQQILDLQADIKAVRQIIKSLQLRATVMVGAKSMIRKHEIALSHRVPQATPGQ